MPCRAVLAAAALLLWPCAAPLAAGDAAAVTYSRDVAPIFRKRCESCHRPGEIAPMSLLTYEDTRPWLRSIQREVASGAMPPWHADPAHGTFANDPRLSAEELATIAKWIEGGAEEGDRADLPPPLGWVEGWRIGKPDVVFEIPEEHDVPDKGVVPYKFFMVPTGFTEDRWVQMADARPGAQDVVHHIIVFVLAPGAILGRGAGDLFRQELTGYAPGEGPSIFPEGTGKLIKAGSTLLFQVHYTPNGKAAKDRSRVGLTFARKPLREEIFTKAVINGRLRIPPNAGDHVVEATSTIREDVILYTLMPHMHLRGKSFEFRLTDPDGNEEVLLSVPRYDFDWQHIYRLAEPRKIAAGSKVRCIARYDNSKQNPANPDPEATVRWGDQTWEEMMIGFLALGRALPEPVDPAAPATKKAADEATAGGDAEEDEAASD